ncbi:unnamed protein product [Urochloa humidicola]
MHYEARVQAIVSLYSKKKHVKVTKEEAKNMQLTKAQYMKVIRWWCANHRACWGAMTDKWLAEDWEEIHLSCR